MPNNGAQKKLRQPTAVHFILFYFANYSPSIAMELKVGKEITCKWQNQRLETNKYVPWALFLKLQTAEVNFEKLSVRLNSFQKPQFQSVSIFFSFVHPWQLLYLLRYFNLPLTFLTVIFMFLLIQRVFCNNLIWLNFVTQLF